MKKENAFTLTEILLSIAIVGVIAALILPSIVTNYQNRALEMGFERETRTISGAVRNLAVSENKVDFFSTIMYSDIEPDGYAETSEKFVKKYLKVSRYCGDSNGDCFSDEYYTYDATTHKKEVYEPVYKGACASLKNGASICITPQIGKNKISGLIDINGKKGPNVYNSDLRPFTINMNVEKTSLKPNTTEVLSTPESDLEPKKPEEPDEPTPAPEPVGPCSESSISYECCETKTVKKGDPCCIHYQSIKRHPCYESPTPVVPDPPTPTPPTCNYNTGIYYNEIHFALLHRNSSSDCTGSSFIKRYANPQSTEGCRVNAGECVIYRNSDKSCHGGLTSHDCWNYQGVHTDEAKAIQEKINSVLDSLL